MVAASAAGDPGHDLLLENLKASYYDNLPPKGKFATGAIVGFAFSRFTVNSAVSALKMTGAAFIASEVIHRSGVFDSVNLLSDENAELLALVNRSFTRRVTNFSTEVRSHLKPERVQATVNSALSQEKMCTIGAATGAFVGFIL